MSLGLRPGRAGARRQAGHCRVCLDPATVTARQPLTRSPVPGPGPTRSKRDWDRDGDSDPLATGFIKSRPCPRMGGVALRDSDGYDTRATDCWYQRELFPVAMHSSTRK